MASLLMMMLANVAMAGVLALLAAAVARWGKRPALAHGLWALVLVKLITPPLWNVKVEWSVGAMEHAEARAVTPENRTVEVPLLITPLPDVVEQEVEIPAALTAPEMVEVTPPTPMKAVVGTPAPPMDWMAHLPAALVGAWIAGSAIVLVTITMRTARFLELLKYATPAERDVQSRARALSWKMQIEHPPGVWFISGAVCPMLWAGLGRARLMIPRALWERLDNRQQSSLLAHELAHLKRRDHWVRLLEVLATVLCWWCPVMWWARAGLREAEEQCCDAWVIWALPGQGRDYAGALLETVEFVSEKGRESGLDPSAPMLASGMGQFHQLARRLNMIRNQNTPRKLSWIGKAVVGAVALAWLPLAPTLAQDAATPAPEVAREIPATTPASESALPSRETLPAPLVAPVEVRVQPPAIDAPGDESALAANDAEMKVIDKIRSAKPGAAEPEIAGRLGDPKMQAEVDVVRAEVKKLEAQLAAAQARLRQLEGRRRTAGEIVDPFGNRRIVEFDAVTGKIIAEHLVGKEAPGTSARVVGPRAGNVAPATSVRPTTPGAGMPPGTTSTLMEAYRKHGVTTRTREQRLEQIESNLKALLDEVKAMKAEGDRDDGGGKPTPPQKR